MTARLARALAILCCLTATASATPKRMPREGCLRVWIADVGTVCLRAAEMRAARRR